MPLFSVVIPTRERAATLAYTLRTCLQQSFDDYEIVVSDNFGSPATKNVVEATGSKRIKYSRSDRDLCMSDNYERAVAMATGDYILVVGDDDGLMPYGLRELAGLIEKHNNPTAVQWRRGLYTWPTIAVPDDANFLLLSTDWKVQIANGRQRLQQFARFEIDTDRLPMINSSAIRRDLIDKHVNIAGRMFVNAHSDIYTGIAFAYLAGEYVETRAPMSIAGLSGNSTGVATLIQEQKTEYASSFYEQTYAAGLSHHPKVPDLRDTPVHSEDSFFWAKHYLFPTDSSLSIDRKAMIARFFTNNRNPDREARQTAHEAIKASIIDMPELGQWVDECATKSVVAPRPRLKPDRFGIDHTGSIQIDTSSLPIENILDAVNFGANLLGYNAGIPFNQLSPEDVIQWNRSDAVRLEREKSPAVETPTPQNSNWSERLKRLVLPALR